MPPCASPPRAATHDQTFAFSDSVNVGSCAPGTHQLTTKASTHTTGPCGKGIRGGHAREADQGLAGGGCVLRLLGEPWAVLNISGILYKRCLHNIMPEMHARLMIRRIALRPRWQEQCVHAANYIGLLWNKSADIISTPVAGPAIKNK